MGVRPADVIGNAVKSYDPEPGARLTAQIAPLRLAHPEH
jgi:hypothetical protein